MSMIMITVRGADPTVSIQTADQTVFGGDPIDLQATSADLTTPVTSYEWTAVPAGGTFSNLAMEDTTWTAPSTTTAIQVVTLTLTVTDSNGTPDDADDITARDSVTITVRRGPVDEMAVTIEAPDQSRLRRWGRVCRTPSRVSECRRPGRYSPVDRHPQRGDVQ